jgi:hypothetical protein
MVSCPHPVRAQRAAAVHALWAARLQGFSC